MQAERHNPLAVSLWFIVNYSYKLTMALAVHCYIVLKLTDMIPVCPLLACYQLLAWQLFLEVVFWNYIVHHLCKYSKAKQEVLLDKGAGSSLYP